MTECAICMEVCGDADPDLIKINCNHIYHRKCLSKWKVPTCPLCRENIKPSFCLQVYRERIDEIMTNVFQDTHPSQVNDIFNVIERIVNMMKTKDNTNYVSSFLSSMTSASSPDSYATTLGYIYNFSNIQRESTPNYTSPDSSSDSNVLIYNRSNISQVEPSQNTGDINHEIPYYHQNFVIVDGQMIPIPVPIPI